MLTRNHRQEILCRAYVQAIAGRCGMAFIGRDYDYGVDVTLTDISRRARRHVESGFRLDIQAKSTTIQNVTVSHVLYDLAVKNYDDLRATDVGCPRVLVVLLLPEDEATWAEQTEEHLVLRRSAYWLSLRGKGPTENRKTVRVEIPRANLFSAKALTALMNTIKKGKRP